MDDMHMCLVCQTTVVGLVNYVNHKKYECSGRKTAASNPICTTLTSDSSSVFSGGNATSAIPNSEFSVPATNNFNQNYLMPQHNAKVSSSFPDLSNSMDKHNALQSPPSSSAVDSLRNNNISVDIQDSFPNLASVGFSPGTSRGVDPNMVMNTRPDSDRPEDFFSSLALQSKSNTKDSMANHQNSVHNLFRNITFDKDGGTENELPIANILNSINFSDDDLDFDEDFLEEAFSDDSEDDVPSSNYTRGKWKPGQGPVRSSGGKWGPSHAGGKWKPDQGPSSGKWKSHMQRVDSESNKRASRLAERETSAPVSRGKNIRMSDVDGEILCKPCGMYFKSRLAYGRHCSGSKHKQNVKDSKFDGDSGSDTEIDETFAEGSEIKENGIECKENVEPSVDENLVKEGESADTTEKSGEDVPSKADDIPLDNEEKSDGTDQEKVVLDFSKDDFTNSTTENEMIDLKPTEKNDSASQDRASQDGAYAVEVVDNPDTEQQEKIETQETVKSEEIKQDNQQIDKQNDSGNVEDGVQNKSPIACNPCDKKFNNKYLMTRHLLSKMHRSRVQGVSDIFPVLTQYHKYIVRLSPFQCAPCQFYFNRESDLRAHLQSVGHSMQWDSLTTEIVCTLCSFSSHSNEEIIQHFQQNLLHEALVKRSKKLCIIREKNYKGSCRYCKKKMHSRVHLKRHLRHKHMVDIDTRGRIAGKFQKHPRGRFQCSEGNCEKKFNTYNAFILHMNKKHRMAGASNVYCRICDKTLSDRYSYGRHCMGDVHKNNLKRRKLLAKENSIKQEFEEDDKDVIRDKLQDQLVHNPNVRKYVRRKERKEKVMETKVHKCDYCDFTAEIYSDLRPHYMEHHEKHILTCDICDLTFLNEKALKLHTGSRQHQANLEEMEGVTGSQTILSCEFCNKRFIDEGSKQWHIDVRHLHPNSEEALRKELGKLDLTSQKYKEFLKEVDEKDRGAQVYCIECNKCLKKESILEHLRLHTGDKPFVCRYCKGGFMSALSLRRHLMSHLGLTERKCELCGKEFKKLESYKEHMKCHEMEKTGARKLMCDVCAMEFYLPKQLRAHMRRHGEKTFKCPEANCHWIFHFANELDAHMKTHTNSRPFLCDICGYAAGTKNRLNRHHRTHTGERNYHCDYCTYKAGTATHLRRHMRIHIGTKPYKCPYCTYSCNTHENIRKHIMKTKKHQGLFIYNCRSSKCRFGSNTVNEFRAHLQQFHPDQYDETRNMEGLAALTGLYVKVEDLSKPEEGMMINPVKERQTRGPKRNRSKNSNGVKEEDDTRNSGLVIDPLYVQEEVVQSYTEEEYRTFQEERNAEREWQARSQMELEQAVKVVQVDTQHFDDDRHYATVQNLMLLNSGRRNMDQSNELFHQQIRKAENAAHPSLAPLVLPGFMDYKTHQQM